MRSRYRSPDRCRLVENRVANLASVCQSQHSGCYARHFVPYEIQTSLHACARSSTPTLPMGSAPRFIINLDGQHLSHYAGNVYTDFRPLVGSREGTRLCYIPSRMTISHSSSGDPTLLVTSPLCYIGKDLRRTPLVTDSRMVYNGIERLFDGESDIEYR
jgi:hypothetical protein